MFTSTVGPILAIDLGKYKTVACVYDPESGEVIDLWAALKKPTLRAAAIDLVHTFGLEPAPPNGTEKRHG